MPSPKPHLNITRSLMFQESRMTSRTPSSRPELVALGRLVALMLDEGPVRESLVRCLRRPS